MEKAIDVITYDKKDKCNAENDLKSEADTHELNKVTTEPTEIKKSKFKRRLRSQKEISEKELPMHEKNVIKNKKTKSKSSSFKRKTIKRVSKINPANVEYITMSILHSPEILFDDNFQGLKLQYRFLKDVKTNYLDRDTNSLKNTKFEVIKKISNFTGKKFILYLDRTLESKKILQLKDIDDTIDLGYITGPEDEVLSDIILVKTDKVKDLISFNKNTTPKINLINIINKAKEKNYSILELNKYFN